ncbi:MAG: hypothetical protein WC679_00390 [Bacteroidales bacterium]|jgi:hypothetical protein
MFFHISKIDLGDKVTLTPRLPDSAVISIEGNQKRICVSTSPLYCFRSITGMRSPRHYEILYEFKDEYDEDDEPLFCFPTLYYTKNKPIKPPDISDFSYNEEHWFIEETEFYKIGYVDMLALINNDFKISTVKKTTTILKDCRGLFEVNDEYNKKVIRYLTSFIDN